MKIDLFTFLGPNSAEYAEFLKYTGEKFSSKKNEINWKCVNSIGCDRIPEGYKVVANSKNMGHVSMNHSVAINSAINFIESDYVIFIDADVALLYKDWDQVIIDELNKYDCFGGEFGSWLRKYRNFPSVYFFTFRSDILNKINLDFSAKLTKNKKHIDNYILNEDDAKYLNMTPNKVVHCDTGWNIPFLFRKTGLTFNKMNAIGMMSKNSQLQFEDSKHKELCMIHSHHMSEWHYKGKIFASHRHASRAFPIDSELGNAWKRKIDLFIKNYEEENKK